VPKAFPIAATLAATVGLAACGGGSTKAARNCFEIWNGSSNKVQQAKVAHRFLSANVTRWRAQGSGNSIVESWTTRSTKAPQASGDGNVGGSTSHGCGYLFHTSKRYISFSAELRGNAVRWVPRPIHGSWSRLHLVAAPDNATVAADGLLSPRTAG